MTKFKSCMLVQFKDGNNRSMRIVKIKGDEAIVEYTIRRRGGDKVDQHRIKLWSIEIFDPKGTRRISVI